MASGRLIPKQVVETRRRCGAMYLAWPTSDLGRALAWFVERLREPGVGAALFA